MSKSIFVTAAGMSDSGDPILSHDFEVEVPLESIISIDEASPAPGDRERAVLELTGHDWSVLWVTETVEDIKAKIRKARGES